MSKHQKGEKPINESLLTVSKPPTKKSSMMSKRSLINSMSDKQNRNSTIKMSNKVTGPSIYYQDLD